MPPSPSASRAEPSFPRPATKKKPASYHHDDRHGASRKGDVPTLSYRSSRGR
jgi:hypothetical protein